MYLKLLKESTVDKVKAAWAIDHINKILPLLLTKHNKKLNFHRKNKENQIILRYKETII